LGVIKNTTGENNGGICWLCKMGKKGLGRKDLSPENKRSRFSGSLFKTFQLH
jgi:hypothetical protein